MDEPLKIGKGELFFQRSGDEVWEPFGRAEGLEFTPQPLTTIDYSAAMKYPGVTVRLIGFEFTQAWYDALKSLWRRHRHHRFYKKRRTRSMKGK